MVPPGRSRCAWRRGRVWKGQVGESRGAPDAVGHGLGQQQATVAVGEQGVGGQPAGLVLEERRAQHRPSGRGDAVGAGQQPNLPGVRADAAGRAAGHSLGSGVGGQGE